MSLGAASFAAQAQQAPPPAQPNAGSVLRDIERAVPATPAAPAPQLDLVAPRTVTAPPAGGPKLAVRSFKLAGVPADKAQTLLPMLARYTGDGKMLADLEDAAKDVEVALQRQGYFLAQAYVPEQTVADGAVTLQVLLGRIGAVKLEVEPGVKVSPELMDRVIATLRGNPVAERELVERALFILGDLRGVLITSTLAPSDKIGQADLTVKVAPGPGFAVAFDVDNGGSIFTGRYRVNAALDWFNLAGRGDVASLKLLSTTNGGAQFARASWLVPVNTLGTKVGVAASYLKYSLGSALFDPLDASGTASAISLQLLHPLVRSRNNNVFLQASTDVREFEDKVGAIGLVTKKRVSPFATFGVVGDFRDTWGGGGISNYTANLIVGRLKYTTPADAVADQAAYRTAGDYAKLALGATRLQSLPNKDFLYLSATAQIASKDLDSSEKFSLGGPNGVRGYPSPDTPSDSALLLSWEYRKPMRFESVPGDVVFSLFGDYGVGRQHESPLPADAGLNVRRLVSHGLGVTYGDDKGLLLKAYVAMRGGKKAQSDDSRARLVVLASKQF